MVARQFPVTGGFTQTQLDNIGEMQANGIELNLRGSVLQQEGLSINVFANTAYENQEITNMGGAPPLKTGGTYPRYRNFLTVGYAPAAFFGAKLAGSDLAEIPLNILSPVGGECVAPSRQQALEYFSQPRDPSSFKPLAIGNSDFGTPNGKLASHNCGSGLLDSYLGKPTPDFAGSFGFNIAFAGNFELNSLLEYKLGHQVQDLSGMFRRANGFIGRNTPRSAELYSIMVNPASSAEQRLDAAVSWAEEIEGLSPMSGMNGIYDADWVQWRELSLVYRIPTSFVESWGLSTATMNMGVRNLLLFMLGDYPGHGSGGQRPRALQRRPQLQLPEFDGRLGHPGATAASRCPCASLSRSKREKPYHEWNRTFMKAGRWRWWPLLAAFTACGLRRPAGRQQPQRSGRGATSRPGGRRFAAVVNGTLTLVASSISQSWQPYLVASDETALDRLAGMPGSRSIKGFVDDPLNEFIDGPFPAMGQARWMSDEAISKSSRSTLVGEQPIHRRSRPIWRAPTCTPASSTW